MKGKGDKMQKATFRNGDFVLHGIPTRAGASRLSAWYCADGILLDCEAINILGHSYRPAKADIELCHKLGKIHK